MVDMKPEPAISCSQARLHKERLGHEPSHKNLDLQFTGPIRYVEVKMEPKLRELPTKD